MAATKEKPVGRLFETVLQIEEARSRPIPEVVAVARRASATGKGRPHAARARALEGLVRFLEECHQDIVDALHRDLRKHPQETSLTEIDPVINDALHTLYNLKSWMKPQQPEKRLLNILDGVYIYPEPYGVVLIIGAWNYPILLNLGPMIGALAAGNCVVLKPSELSPATADMMSKLLPHYIDNELVQVVVGGVEESTELLKQQFDYIFFTGSTTVGKIVYEAAARQLTPVTLELGGKSPVFVDESADIDMAAKRVMWGKCLNAGQTCIAPDYVLCSKAVQEEFVAAARRAIEGFYGADGKFADMSRILTERHYKRLVGFIQHGEVAVGGQCDPAARVIAPTILVNVKRDDPVMQEEIFGPVLPIYVVKDAKEAVEFVNGRPKPLALYLFTAEKTIERLFLENTSSGGVTVNDTIMHIVTENLPFGGVGASGIGAYHGRRGFDTFSHQKSVLKRDLDFVSEAAMAARYPPYSEMKAHFLSVVTRRRRAIPFAHIRNGLIFALGFVIAIFINYFLCN